MFMLPLSKVEQLLNHNCNGSRKLFMHHVYLIRMKQPKTRVGRPPKPEAERLIQRSIRLQPDLWAKIDANGLAWLRAVIRRARSPAG